MLKHVTTTSASHSVMRSLFVTLVVSLLAACGGGSSGDNDQPTGDEGQQIGEAGPMPGTEDPGTEGPGVDSTPQMLSVGESISGTLQEEEIIVYRVPADTEIILTTQSGDADIALHEAQELTEETLLCLANEPFVEDNCKAESSSGLMYASVYAVEDSTYTISASSDCSTEAINRWVYRSMNDYYLFADQVPTVDPETYSDPSDLIRDLRNNSVDPYSRVTDTQTRQAFFDEGKSFGFGAGIFSDVNDVFRIAYVYDDAPFGRAGVKRGDIVVSVGGVPFDEVIGDLTGDLYNQLVGTVDEPLTVDWTFIDGDSGVSKTITTARSEYTINTVLYSNHYSVDGFSDRIGYLVFKSFLRPSEAELDNTIAEFAEAGVTEMVLDLRYNGGGYTHIARRLAAQIGGPSLDGLRAVSYEYNDKYTDVNFNRDFAAAEPSLNLSRLVVLTSEGTASSSELLINSLRPYMEVITIGETTEGKPYISRGRDFCDKTIDAMEAQGTNSNGVSVIGGIPADCYAADDLSRNFGLQSDSIEGMLQSALNYVTDGSCSAAPVTAARSRGIEILPDNEPQFAGALDDVGTPALPLDLSKR